MEITNKIVRGRIFEVFIQADFDPVEIIVVREDGTCESNRAVNSLNYTRRLLAMETEANQKLSAEIERLKSLNAAALETADANVASLLQMRAERDGAHKYAERLKSDLFASMNEVERLSGELKSANDELQKLSAAYEAQRPDWQINHLKEIGELVGVTGQESVYQAVKRLKTELEALNSQRLREIADVARMPHVHLDEVRTLKAEIERLKPYSWVVCIGDSITGAQWTAQTVYGMSLDEVRTLKAERDELKGKVGKISAELDKAKSIFNMAAQTVYGMSLDEIRKIKAERDALQAECQLKNKWIEGARELEAIRVQLAEQGIKI